MCVLLYFVRPRTLVFKHKINLYFRILYNVSHGYELRIIGVYQKCF